MSLETPVAVVLAGGRSRRFGSDKLIAELDGRTLLDRALDDVPPDWPVIVIGPTRELSRAVTFALEDPPDGGPGAALVRGAQLVLAAGRSALVSLAGDAPGGGRAARQLWTYAVANDSAAVVATDQTGREQPLQLCVRGDALRRLAAVEDATDIRARDLLPLLTPLDRLALPPELTEDIDTPGQAERWRDRLLPSGLPPQRAPKS